MHHKSRLETGVLPDVVRVPVLVDDDPLGADGDGASLVVGAQVVFSDVHSVRATSAVTDVKIS